MMIKIAIADTNVEYLERLTGVLDEYADLRISVFSDASYLSEGLAGGRYDVLLLDPSLYDRRLPLEKVPVTIFLTGETRVPYEMEEAPMIRKYQRISQIHQKLLEICSLHLPGMGASAREGHATVYAFYSPVGGAGKTTAALIAATRLSMQGKKTFYLNLEAFAGDGCYLPAEDAENGMSSLLERLSGKGNPAMYMQSCLLAKNDNLHYMKHFDSPNDYAAMDIEDLEALIRLFRDFGAFDYVVVDMDSCFDAKAKCVFGLSDKVVIVEKDDAIGIGKMERFYAQTYILSEYGDKMARVLNFSTGREPGLSTELPLVGRIPATGGADSASLITTLSAGSAAAFTDALSDMGKRTSPLY